MLEKILVKLLMYLIKDRLNLARNCSRMTEKKVPYLAKKYESDTRLSSSIFLDRNKRLFCIWKVFVNCLFKYSVFNEFKLN